ncbi:hypothetical protein RHSIM_RhsimUnG0036400 [Rhododendron simsii]|uniref:Pentatricopeptide repeat-containing protein n=1 Tax=Rhododendron simsii TaxID=118357 RepID=A0A834FXH6_RHOSS|nr:hypothetical protein RHSIM_RhsimUnG0036400 [Rhododendron simsii]
MSEPDVVSWNALALGYDQLGHGSEAKKVFDDVENKGIRLNRVSCNGMIAKDVLARLSSFLLSKNWGLETETSGPTDNA